MARDRRVSVASNAGGRGRSASYPLRNARRRATQSPTLNLGTGGRTRELRRPVVLGWRHEPARDDRFRGARPAAGVLLWVGGPHYMRPAPMAHCCLLVCLRWLPAFGAASASSPGPRPTVEGRPAHARARRIAPFDQRWCSGSSMRTIDRPPSKVAVGCQVRCGLGVQKTPNATRCVGGHPWAAVLVHPGGAMTSHHGSPGLRFIVTTECSSCSPPVPTIGWALTCPATTTKMHAR
jgi:hypothetical protein